MRKFWRDEMRIWAIKRPAGDFCLWCAYFTKKETIRRFMVSFVSDERDWGHLRSKGFNCVKVEIREVEK